VPTFPRFLLLSALLLCVALPWLNPISSGPSVVVVSALVAWWGAAALLALAGAGGVGRDAFFRALALGWALAALASALMGLLQYFDAVPASVRWINQGSAGQAFGNLRQRNQFATLCSMGLALMWWWVQHGQALGAQAGRPWPALGLRQRVARLGALLGSALLASALLASGSRTGLLQLLLLCALAWLWRGTQHRRGLWLAAWMLLVYVLAAYALPLLAGVDGSVLERLRGQGEGCFSRVYLWRNVLYLIAQKPLWGWGAGELDFAHFMTLYPAALAGPRFCDILDNAHNLPLHLAVEHGLPLALLACAALLAWLARAAPWREAQPPRQLAWAVLALIGLHSLLEYPLWYGPFQMAALLSMWVLWAFRAGAPALGAAPAQSRPARVLLLCGALALAPLCAVAHWSYWRMGQLYLPADQRAPNYRNNTFSKVQGTWLFAEHVRFAELSVTPVEPDNAAHVLALAQDLLHFSPEPMVIAKLMDAAVLLGQTETLHTYAPRFAAAFAQDWVRWCERNEGVDVGQGAPGRTLEIR